MYKKIDANENAVQREKEILKFWKDNNVFKLSENKNAKGKEFSFYDGPPTANGKPHIGHILTRVMKDIIPRFKTMKGYHALRKAGWDTHGLPVELEVEKLLGMDGKQDIEKYGIEPFINKCKQSVWKYTTEWEKMSDRVGYWVDMEHPYITYDDNYIESVWWSLKEIYKKGLIYKGHKIVPYCPRCGTALSSHEVAQGYKDVKENSVVIKFKVKGEDNTFILAWTTTPWTLPSNVACCFHPNYDYCLLKAGDEKFIMAKELIGNFFTDYEILDTKKGIEYEGLEYEPLYNCYNGKKKYCYVVCDEYVTLTDGTGVVHNAPAFGEDDANVGRKYDLPFLQMVDERGLMAKGAPFEGTFCKDADKLIIKDLIDRNLMFKVVPFTHSYPFCWRCDTPLLYYARSTWFIKMTEVRDKLIKNNASVNWIPDSIGKGRMGNFLENVIDWGLSRDRYWGTPLPIWVCDECGHIEVIGSKAELKEKGHIQGDIELHKPYVDEVTITCPHCGKPMHRTPEVIDCWYDSGSMPFAQYHYPFENKELFEKTFPADFISEAVDQTRGWFYTLLAISTLLFDKAPFKNCIVLGHVNDKNGIKMSKHKGNVVDPFSVLDKQGADAVRWYFYTNSNPWLPSRFYDEAVNEAQRKFLGTLYNTYSFYVLYADIDSFNPFNYNLKDCALTLMDKWILSSLNSLVKTVDDYLENYKITESARAIEKFTDSLSNWYVRRCRERFWAKGMEKDKIAAYMTLFTVLDTLIKISAPYTPFMAESIYQNITKSVNKDAPLSVHLCDYPTVDESFINEELNKGMEVALVAATLGRGARNTASIKNRQPLQRILLCGDNVQSLDKELMNVIKEELNVKEIDFIDDASEYVSYEVKPQLKTLGPKYGKKLNGIRTYLSANGEKVVSGLRENGEYKFMVDDTEIVLAPSDVLTTAINKEGFVVQSESGIAVILDTAITDDLKKEGYMREIISKIQNTRKESGFFVTDHINITIKGDDEINNIVKEFTDVISSSVLANSITIADNEGEKFDINDKQVVMTITK